MYNIPTTHNYKSVQWSSYLS